MRILTTYTLKGLNYWSNDYQKLIVVNLNLESSLTKFNAKIMSFYRGLNKILPSIQNRHYDLKHQGEFLQQVSLSKAIIRIALELQNLVNLPVKFGCARTSSTGIEQIVFEYQTAKAGCYAAKAAIRICQSLIEYGSYPQIELAEDLEDLRKISSTLALNPSTVALIKEAESRQIPWLELPVKSLIQLGYGKNQRRIQTSLSDRSLPRQGQDRNSTIRLELAQDKLSTQTLLRKTGFPVPDSQILSCRHHLETAIDRVGGYPVVIKAVDSIQKRGISLELENWEEALAAYDIAVEKSLSSRVMVEKYYGGLNYRILVVNGKVVAVVETMVAHAIGDGKSTIIQLIQQSSQEGSKQPNNLFIFDSETERILSEQDFTSQSIPEPGEIVYLKATANYRNGGITFDCTDKIHPENIWLVQRAAKIIGLELAEIDLVCLDISRPLRYCEGVIIGINSVPDLNIYLKPDFGQPRNVAAPILDWLYPTGIPTRIPIIAVTANETKNIVIDLIAHLFKQTRQVVGYTSNGNTYINDYKVNSSAESELSSSEIILQDPTVDVAVLKVTESEIQSSGLSFDFCDVSLLLNPTSIEETDCESVLTQIVKHSGYVVLDADQPGVEEIAKQVTGTVVYFSLSLQNHLLQKHLFQGGLAAVYQNGYLSLCQERQIIPVELAINVPFVTKRPVLVALSLALAASLVAYVQGVSIADISTALRTFQVTRKLNYSGVNLIAVGKVHILVACPEDSLTKAVGTFVSSWQQGERIGVIGAKSDRPRQDLIELGKLSAQIFDRVILKEDDEPEIKNQGEIAELIGQGIKQQQPLFDYELILDEIVAIHTALTKATAGSLIVILSERVSQAVSLLQQPSLFSLTSFSKKLLF